MNHELDTTILGVGSMYLLKKKERKKERKQ